MTRLGVATWAKRHLAGLDFAVISILVVALALRLVWVLRAETTPQGTADPAWYFAVASNLVDGHGFTVIFGDGGWAPGPGGTATALYPPGWPSTLATSFVLFGKSLITAKLVNVLAGVATVYLVYRIGELSLTRKTGLIGASLLALYPNHIIWSSTLFPDVYFTMWFAAAVFLLLRTQALRGRWAIAGAAALGIVTGVAALTRGQGVLLVPLAAVFWLMARGRRDALVRAAVACVVAAVVIIPWTVRNAVTFEALILISSEDGYNLRMGHAPYATGRYIIPRDLWETQPGITFKEREALFSRLGRERAIDYAVTHPVEEAILAVKKLYFLALPDSDSIGFASMSASPIAPSWVLDGLGRLADVYYYALLLAAAVGLIRSRDITAVRFIAVALGAWAAFHMLFIGEPRLHIPLLPLLVVPAAAALQELWGIFMGANGGRRTARLAR